MRDELIQLVKHTAVYGFGRIFSKVISFLLIPFYTHYFTAAEYGIMEVLNLTVMILAIVLAPGLANAVMRFHYDTNDEHERSLSVSTALIFTIISGGLVILLAFAFPQKISYLLLNSAQHGTVIKLLAIGFYCSFFSDICYVYLRGRKRSGVYVALTQVYLVLSILTNIYFVAIRHSGVAGVFAGNIVAGTVVGAILLWMTIGEVGIHFSPHRLVELLKFGAPLILTWLAAFVLNFSDRFFLQRYSDLSQVGIYAVGYKFGYITSMLLIQPFHLMWEPQSYEIAAKPNGKAIFGRIFSFYMLGLLCATFFLSLFIRETFEVMVDRKFLIAYHLVPIIAVAYLGQGVQGFFEAGLLIQKKSKTVGTIGLVAALTCVGLNFLLIWHWKMMGACVATLLSLFLMGACTAYFCQRHYPIPVKYAALVRVAVVGLTLLLMVWFLPVESFFLRLLIKVVVAVLFVYFITVSGALEADEVKTIKELAVEKLKSKLSFLSWRPGALANKRVG